MGNTVVYVNGAGKGYVRTKLGNSPDFVDWINHDLTSRKTQPGFRQGLTTQLSQYTPIVLPGDKMKVLEEAVVASGVVDLRQDRVNRDLAAATDEMEQRTGTSIAILDGTSITIEVLTAEKISRIYLQNNYLKEFEVVLWCLSNHDPDMETALTPPLEALLSSRDRPSRQGE